MSRPLSDDDQAVLSARADSFHAALSRGAAGDLERHLDGVSDRVRLALLPELVMDDLKHRWEHGERPAVEDYLRRFPELGPADRVPTAVIVEECRCRAKAGERVSLSAYRLRFPEQYYQVRSQLVAAARSGSVAAGTVASVGPAATVGPAPREAGGPSPAPPAAARVGPGTVVRDYEFVRQLGRGQFGAVWLARKESCGIEKAVKVVGRNADPGGADRERRALELVKNLRHPYLLAIDDFWEADGRLYIVMELADGTLGGRLKACRAGGGPGIPPGELLGYVREAAEVLDFLHAHHVLHRDVKPDNFLLLNGHVKVGDLGLARRQEGTIERMKTFAGTPVYMAPEVWGQEGGPPSDQYSLVCTYVELRQGRRLFRGRGMGDLYLAHLEGAYDLDAGLGADERAVLARALARDARQRYPSCRAFAEALAAAVPLPATAAHGSVSAASGPVTAVTRVAPAAPTAASDSFRLPPPRSRPPVVLLAALALLLVALGMALALVISRVVPDVGRHGRGDVPSRVGPIPGFINPASGGELWAVAGKGETSDGRRTYWNELELDIDGLTVPFVLVPQNADADPEWAAASAAVETFYVMRDKVSVRFYERFVNRRGAAGYVAVKRGGHDFPIGLRDAWRRPPPGAAGGFFPRPENEPLPAFRVDWFEAWVFADEWLGGGLPTRDEYRKMAGYFRRGGRAGPYDPAATPQDFADVYGVGRGFPLPAGSGRGGDNPFGLRDLAGNGREWTRTGRHRAVGHDHELPVETVLLGTRDNPPAREFSFVACGASYLGSAARPLEYADLEKAVGAVPAPDAAPDLGFRVVLRHTGGCGAGKPRGATPGHPAH